MRRVGSIPAACSSCASIVIVLVASAAARADQAPPLDETALARLVWERAPGVLASRRGEIDARAWAERTRLLPNPVLGATWGTVPIGERNPPSAGFWSIPSYQVGVSELIELGKRGPRQRAADAATRVARFDALDAYRITFFDVLESLGDQAAAVARAAVLERLVADSAESVRLQRVRADKGDVATIEVERLEVEHARLTSSLREARVAREAALADCSTLLGALCPRFDREPDALAFLELAARERPTGTDVSALARRPDLLALDAVRDQSLAEATLAKRQVIPDPVVSLSYMNDRNVVAGNQPQSVTAAVSIPLPVFDRGQPEQRRARERVRAAAAARQAIEASARVSLVQGRARLELLAERAKILDDEALPRARGVIERLEAAARRGGAALPELLLARRALEELQLDRLEVAREALRALVDVRRHSAALPPPPSAS